MRVLLLLCLFSAPAFGQGPTLDFTTGNGQAPLLWVQQTLKVGASPANFYMQRIDEYWGTLTFTSPTGTQAEGPAPIPVGVAYVYPLNATVTATTVTWTGFSGGPIVNGAAPTPGAPFALPPSFPPGWSAVWRVPVIQQRSFVPYQLFAVSGGVPSNAYGAYKPQVP